MISRLSAGFASVDCTAEENKKLCDDEKNISISDDTSVQRKYSGNAILLNKSKGSEIRHFEVYHGPRNAEKLSRIYVEFVAHAMENDTQTTTNASFASSSSSERRGGEEETVINNH